MTDIFERAQELDQLHQQEAWEQHCIEMERNRLRRASQSVHPRTTCDCGEEISAERREAVPGCTTCAACQRATEARNKLMNR